MAKLLIAVVAVAALAYGGWKLGHRANHAATGAVDTLVLSIPQQAALTAAEANLATAASNAAAFLGTNGSYAGLSLPGVTVVATSNGGTCLETTLHGATAHLDLPNGSPASGGCG
jgi:hypothetical protein